MFYIYISYKSFVSLEYDITTYIRYMYKIFDIMIDYLCSFATLSNKVCFICENTKNENLVILEKKIFYNVHLYGSLTDLLNTE